MSFILLVAIIIILAKTALWKLTTCYVLMRIYSTVQRDFHGNYQSTTWESGKPYKMIRIPALVIWTYSPGLRWMTVSLPQGTPRLLCNGYGKKKVIRVSLRVIEDMFPKTSQFNFVYCVCGSTCMDVPSLCSTKHLELLIFTLTRLQIIFLLLPFLSPQNLPHLIQKYTTQVWARLLVWLTSPRNDESLVNLLKQASSSARPALAPTLL